MDSTTQQQQLLSPDEVATRLGIGRRRVYELIKYQGLPAYRLGHLLRVDAGELSSWLQSQSTVGAR